MNRRRVPLGATNALGRASYAATRARTRPSRGIVRPCEALASPPERKHPAR
jgi:hypothetical protein